MGKRRKREQVASTSESVSSPPLLDCERLRARRCFVSEGSPSGGLAMLASVDIETEYTIDPSEGKEDGERLVLEGVEVEVDVEVEVEVEVEEKV